MRTIAIRCFFIVVFTRVTALRLPTSQWHASTSKGFEESNDSHFLRNLLASTATALLCFAFYHPPANAAIASLADVGVKEFLVKDGRQFLRLTIPEGEQQQFKSTTTTADIRNAQENLELVRLRFEQVGFTNPTAWGTALKDANSAANIIKERRFFLVNQPSGIESQSNNIRERIFDEQLVPSLDKLSESIRARDIDRTLEADEAAAQALADLRLLQLPIHELPFVIPEEYSQLPQLTGRATVDMVVQSKTGVRLSDGKTIIKDVPLRLTLDGYHAPLTAGNFIDLVQHHYYDNMPLQKVEELTVQTGKPVKGDIDGYVDPKTGQLRTIPLELFYKNDKEPVYGITSDDDRRATETMALPFQAYGALGMARNNEYADSASSQFFFLKWKQALIAPGRNTLDGFYSCMGYVTRNEDLLSQLTQDDIIKSAVVVEGADNLRISSATTTAPR